MNAIMLIAVIGSLWMLVVGPRIAGFIMLVLMTCLWLFVAIVGALL